MINFINYLMVEAVVEFQVPPTLSGDEKKKKSQMNLLFLLFIYIYLPALIS